MIYTIANTFGKNTIMSPSDPQHNISLSSREIHNIAVYCLGITFCPLIPIPFVDFFLEPWLANKMLQPFVKDSSQRKLFTDKRGMSCMGCLGATLLWPILKLIKTLRFFLQFKTYLRSFQYWFYKAYIVHKAMHKYTDIVQKEENMKQFALDVDDFLHQDNTFSIFTKHCGTWIQNSPLHSIQHMFRSVPQENANIPTQTHNVFRNLLENTQFIDQWMDETIAKYS